MIVRRAAECLRAGEIREALRLYELAATRYGKDHFSLNISHCRKLLNSGSQRAIPVRSVTLLLGSAANLARWPSDYLDTPIDGWDVHFFLNSEDGPRPVHDRRLLAYPDNAPLASPGPTHLPESSFYLAIDPSHTILPEDLASYLQQLAAGSPPCASAFQPISIQTTFIQQERVSIIVPTYKRPDTLARALESVLTQDYPDKELIVVDDSGQETAHYQQTLAIVAACQQRFPDTLVYCIGHTRNRNGSAARNTGLLNASGEYICFLDDDDIYLPERLSRSIATLKQCDADCAAVYCGYLGWNSERDDKSRYIAGDLSREILLLEYSKHYLHTNTATYRRQAVLELGGFDETYRRHQDLEFNLRYFSRYKIATVESALVRLAPEPTSVNNKSYAQELAKLKLKFLTRFSGTITRFDPETISAIHLAHLAEIANKYTNGI